MAVLPFVCAVEAPVFGREGEVGFVAGGVFGGVAEDGVDFPCLGGGWVKPSSEWGGVLVGVGVDFAAGEDSGAGGGSGRTEGGSGTGAG